MHKQRPTTAVIAVAGWGTRWLPLTKAIEKCMLPIGNRPVVDWVVADCVQAGITRFVFIVSPEQAQIRQFYSHNVALNMYLNAKGKHDALEITHQPQYKGVTFEFVIQDPNGKYGTAAAVALAAESLVGESTFAVFMGDDFVFRPDGGNEIADFIDAWQQSDAPHAMLASEVPKEEAGKYGVISGTEDGKYKEILEKPSAEAIADFSKTYVNISKYIFDASMLGRIVNFVDGPVQTAEYYITDPINAAAAEGESIYVHPAGGVFLDAGTPETWLAANNQVAAVQS